MTLKDQNEEFERAARLVRDTLIESVGEYQYDFLPEARDIVRALINDGWTRR